MSLNSKIEWTDTTWNPVRGCTKISAGCKNCYAERFVRTIKEGCLERMILFGEESLRTAVREFMRIIMANETAKAWVIYSLFLIRN